MKFNSNNTTIKKRVRFSDQNTIRYTHSSKEYDRSCFVMGSSSSPAFTAPRIKHNQVQPLMCMNPPIIYSQQKQHLQKKKQQPILKIDTSINNGLGPLFLTGNSSNYYYSPFQNSFINRYTSIDRYFVNNVDIDNENNAASK